MIKIGVVILSYNNHIDTKECIDSLLKVKTKYKVTLLVVDNSSDEEYYRMNLSLMDKAIILRTDNNGYAAGNNIGIKYFVEENYDYALVINNDTIVSDKFLDILVDNFDDKTGITAPTIYTYNDNPPKIWSSGGRYRKILCDYSMKRDYFEGVRINKFISGCCFLIKLENVPLIGYIEEDYFMYSEDTDLSHQYNKRGLLLKTISESVIWHKESISTGKESPFQIYYLNRGKLQFIYKNYQGIKRRYALFINILLIYSKIIKLILHKDKKYKFLLYAIKDRKKMGKTKRVLA